MHRVKNHYVASYENDVVSLEDLGITYSHMTHQPMGDCTWYWNCRNVPSTLPYYIKELNIDPMNQIGWDLSEEEAKQIKEMQISNKQQTFVDWKH